MNTALQTAQWLGHVVFYYDALLFWGGGVRSSATISVRDNDIMRVYDEQGDM